jgi:hypothetical protein
MAPATMNETIAARTQNRLVGTPQLRRGGGDADAVARAMLVAVKVLIIRRMIFVCLGQMILGPVNDLKICSMLLHRAEGLTTI